MFSLIGDIIILLIGIAIGWYLKGRYGTVDALKADVKGKFNKEPPKQP